MGSSRLRKRQGVVVYLTFVRKTAKTNVDHSHVVGDGERNQREKAEIFTTELSNTRKCGLIAGDS